MAVWCGKAKLCSSWQLGSRAEEQRQRGWGKGPKTVPKGMPPGHKQTHPEVCSTIPPGEFQNHPDHRQPPHPTSHSGRRWGWASDPGSRLPGPSLNHSDALMNVRADPHTHDSPSLWFLFFLPLMIATERLARRQPNTG